MRGVLLALALLPLPATAGRVLLSSPPPGPAQFNTAQFQKSLTIYLKGVSYEWMREASEALAQDDLVVSFSWNDATLVTSLRQPAVSEEKVFAFVTRFQQPWSDFYRAVALRLRSAIRATSVGRVEANEPDDIPAETVVLGRAEGDELEPSTVSLGVSAAALFGMGPWAVALSPTISARLESNRWSQGVSVGYGAQLLDRSKVRSHLWRLALVFGRRFSIRDDRLTLVASLESGVRSVHIPAEKIGIATDLLGGISAALEFRVGQRTALVLRGAVDVLFTNTRVPVQAHSTNISGRFAPEAQVGVITRI